MQTLHWVIFGSLVLFVLLIVVVSILIWGTQSFQCSKSWKPLKCNKRRKCCFTGPTGAANNTNNDTGVVFPYQPTFIDQIILSNITGFTPQSPIDNTLVGPWGAVLDKTDAPNFNRLWVAINGESISTGGLNQYLLSVDSANSLLTETGAAPFSATLTLLQRVVIDDALTGVDMNLSTGAFLISSGPVTGPALLITVSESGRIWGWNPLVSSDAIEVIDNSATSNYKGCALDNVGKLWVCNWRTGFVEIYDSEWNLLMSITDPQTTLITVAGFTPYNIVMDVDDLVPNVIVTFAFQNGGNRPTQGLGNGFIDRFSLDGSFLRRASQGHELSAPWGILEIPFPGILPDFVSAQLGVVDTFGRLFIYRDSDGQLLSIAKDTFGNDLVIPGGFSITQMSVSNYGVTGLVALALVTSSTYNGAGGFITAISATNRLQQE